MEREMREEDITAIGLLQSDESEVLVSGGEELEKVDESAFEKLITSALEQSRYDIVF